MRIILGSITGSTKLYRVPSWLGIVIVLGLCPPLLGGWFAQSSGNWDLFERSGSITAAIGLVVASRRYFQYAVRELATLRANDEQKLEVAALLEDVLMAKEGLALSAFGTIVWGWGKYLEWWSFSFLLVWAWFALRDFYRDYIRESTNAAGGVTARSGATALSLYSSPHSASLGSVSRSRPASHQLSWITRQADSKR